MKDKNNSQILLLELVGLLVLGFSLVFILNKINVKNNGQEGQTNLYSQSEILTGTLQAYPGPGERNISTPTINTVKPPNCNFENFGIQNEQTTSTFVEYTYSEPKVILSSDSILGIAGWLPDSQKLLLLSDKENGNQEISTYDINTYINHVYASRNQISSSKPFWINNLQAVVYTSDTNKTNSMGEIDELRISFGDPEASEQISYDVASMSLSSNSNQVIYFSPSNDSYPKLGSADTREIKNVLINLANWTYPKYPGMLLSPIGRILWTAIQPNKGLITTYYGPWLFISQTTETSPCEVVLITKKGDQAGIKLLRWSPDGQNMAFVISEYLNNNFLFNYLTILNIYTGDVYQPSLPAKYIYDIAWSPDSQTLAILGRPLGNEKVGISADIYIENINHKNIKKLSFNQQLGGGREGLLLAWSPNNKFIAIKCAIWDEIELKIHKDQICLIEVNHQRK